MHLIINVINIIIFLFLCILDFSIEPFIKASTFIYLIINNERYGKQLLNQYAIIGQSRKEKMM